MIGSYLPFVLATTEATAADFWEKAAIAVVGGLTGVIIKAIYDHLVIAYSRPVLRLDFLENSPGFRLTTLERTADGKIYDAIFFSIGVTNRGINTAKNARGFLMRIEFADERGVFRSTDYSDNLPLAWSYRSEEDAQRGIDLPPSVPQFLNVLSVRNPHIATGFSPATVPQTLQRASLFRFEREGIFRFTIMVVAEGARPALIGLRVSWKGTWEAIWQGNCEALRVMQDTTIEFPRTWA